VAHSDGDGLVEGEGADDDDETPAGSNRHVRHETLALRSLRMPAGQAGRSVCCRAASSDDLSGLVAAAGRRPVPATPYLIISSISQARVE
jgi:hypothetical protein